MKQAVAIALVFIAGQAGIARAQSPAAPSPDSTAQIPAAPAPAPAQPPAANPPAPEPDAAAMPVPEARKGASVKNERYNVPLKFDPDEQGVKILPPEIDYDLTTDRGATLRIGNVSLNDRTLLFALRAPSEVNPALAPFLGEEGRRPALLMRWPAPLLKGGLLEMISRSGQVLWKYEITPEAVDAWKKRLDDLRRQQQSGGNAKANVKSGIFSVLFAIEDVRSRGAPFWNQKDTFRFCLSQTDGAAQTRLCTGRFIAQMRDKDARLVKVPTTTEPRVVVMNKDGALKDVVPVPGPAPAQFYADLSTGASYEFLVPVPKMELVDIIDTAKPNVLRLSGFGPRPVGRYIILNPDQYNRLTTFLGFEPTILDNRKFWATALKADDPKIFFAGDGGGVFRQRFELNDIPRRALRPFMDGGMIQGTYIDGARLWGRKQPKSKVSSEQQAAGQDDDQADLFWWDFAAPTQGEINRSYLTVTDGPKSFKAFLELYRGYGNELSARASLILATKPLLMTEIAYNHWFENFFGWDQYWLTRQRWGLSAKYFKSMNQLTVGNGKNANLDVATADLKYRLSPGLWTRDETVGLMASFQDVKFGELHAPAMGGGVFWARSMPRVFDEILSLFPFLDSPKWVDMEFIYYAMTTNKDVRLNNMLSLNFHGQVLWKKNFFGEAGFGFKRYALADLALKQEAKLNTVYGTAGLGFKF